MPSNKDRYLGKGHQLKYSEEGFYLQKLALGFNCTGKENGDISGSSTSSLQKECVRPDRAKSWWANTKAICRWLTDQSWNKTGRSAEKKFLCKEIREVSHFRRQKRLNRLKVQEMLPEGDWGWKFVWWVYKVPVPSSSSLFWYISPPRRKEEIIVYLLHTARKKKIQ